MSLISFCGVFLAKVPDDDKEVHTLVFANRALLGESRLNFVATADLLSADFFYCAKCGRKLPENFFLCRLKQ